MRSISTRITHMLFPHSVLDVNRACISINQYLTWHVSENFISKRTRYQKGSRFQRYGDYSAHLGIIRGMFTIPRTW